MIRPTLPLVLCFSACTGETTPIAQTLRPIIDGRSATIGQLLSTVALTDGGGESFCTGTLIAPTVVITAAHCLQTEDESGWITSGDVEVAFNTLDAAPAAARQRRVVRSVHPHPSYLQAPEGNDDAGLAREDDIAVLVLAAPVDQPVTPILPAALLDRLVQGTPLTIAGYGQTDLDDEGAYGRLHIGETPYVRRNGFELLAGGNGTDTCFGDSGGPAYVTLDGVRYLVGATSRSADDAQVDCGDRGIYTLVPSYQGWIDQVVSGAPQPAPPVDPADEGADDEGAEDEAVDDEGADDEGVDDEGADDEGADDEEADDEGADDEEAFDDGEPGADVCAEERWYGDGECDDFRDRPDPDCGEGDDSAEDAPDADREPEVLRRRGRDGCQGAPGGADAPAGLLALGALLLLRRRR